MLTRNEISDRPSSEFTRLMVSRCRPRSVSVESISSSRMNRIRKLSTVSLSVCILASTRAGSQAITGYAANASVPAKVTSAQVVPSNSAPVSTAAIQGGDSNPQTGPRKYVHAEAVKGSLTKGGIHGQLPSLCFVPGIGWQPIPSSPLGLQER